MRARSAWAAVGGAVPVVALLSDGCRTPTQVTLELGTNVVCADMRGVEIVVAGNPQEAEHRSALDAPGTRFSTATTDACTEGAPPRTIGTLVVTPSSGSGAVVVIAAFGGAKVSDCIAPNFGPGCIVARRRFAFADHTASTLPIVLDPICAGVPCNESSTCVGKKCVDSEVDCASGACTDPGKPSPDGGLVEVDSASPLDSSAPLEASSDAPHDAHGDAPDATVEGGNDGGPRNNCDVLTKCIAQPLTCTSASVHQSCCYAGDGGATCQIVGTCPDISGCCNDSNDCAPGLVCCASTPTKQQNTVVECKPRAQCGTGRVVCAKPSTNEGCGGSLCLNAGYSTFPNYYICS